MSDCAGPPVETATPLERATLASPWGGAPRRESACEASLLGTACGRDSLSPACRLPASIPNAGKSECLTYTCKDRNNKKLCNNIIMQENSSGVLNLHPFG